MTVCDRTCDPPCSYGCELGQKGVNTAPSAMPSRMNKVGPPTAKPVWEKQIISERRPDGSRMPILAPGPGPRRPLRIKEYTQHRRKIDEQVKQVRTS